MSKYIYFSFLIIALVFLRCTSAKKDLKNVEYRTVITLVKRDTFPVEIRAIEHYNENGKILERIRFLQLTPVIIGFDKFLYDSENNLIYRHRRSSPSFWITDFEKNNYNKENRRFHQMWVSSFGKIITHFDYYPNGKLKANHFESKSEMCGSGLVNYYYNSQDSLIRTEEIYVKKSERNSRDSIVYENNRKTTYSIDAENIRTRKYVVIYRKGKIVHEYSYSHDYLFDENEFYLNERKSYFYKDNLLIKMIVKHSPINAWCGTGNNGYTEIFTYFYE